MKPAEAAEPIKAVVQEQFGALEAVWADNADGLPQADVVIIRPGEGANRRFYSQEAIAEAVHNGFWDDSPMFADHGDRAMPRKRSINDLRAKIEPGSTYVGQEGEARGKVTFIDPDFAAKAKRAGKHIGLSGVHEFMGQRYRGKDGHMHERVDKLVVRHSVDFVAFPAAGGEIAAFLPAQESEDDVDYNSPLLNIEALKQHRPDLIEALAAESDGGDDGDDKEGKPEAPVPAPVPQPEPPAPEGFVTLAVAKSIAQEAAEHVRDEFVAKERKQSATRTAVSAHIAKSGLPEKTRARLMTAFEGQEEYDQKAVQESIDAAAEELKETGWKGPVVFGLGDSTAQESEDLPDKETLGKLAPTMTAVEAKMAFVPRSGAKLAHDADDGAGRAN